MRYTIHLYFALWKFGFSRKIPERWVAMRPPMAVSTPMLRIQLQEKTFYTIGRIILVGGND
jgi:hypothetical protein